MAADRHERFVYRTMPYFAGLMALASGAITVAIALNSSVQEVVEYSEPWLAVFAGLGALLSILAAVMLFADKSWGRYLLVPAIGCVLLAVFIISLFFPEETLFWLAVLSALVTLLFAFASVALFLGKNWGRLLLGVMLGALLVFVIVMTGLILEEAMAMGGLSYLLSRLGIGLLLVFCLLAPIVVLCRGSRRSTRLATEAGSHVPPPDTTGAGV